jgi:hypothetical protein
MSTGRRTLSSCSLGIQVITNVWRRSRTGGKNPVGSSEEKKIPSTKKNDENKFQKFSLLIFAVVRKFPPLRPTTEFNKKIARTPTAHFHPYFFLLYQALIYYPHRNL